MKKYTLKERLLNPETGKIDPDKRDKFIKAIGTNQARFYELVKANWGGSPNMSTEELVLSAKYFGITLNDFITQMPETVAA